MLAVQDPRLLKPQHQAVVTLFLDLQHQQVAVAQPATRQPLRTAVLVVVAMKTMREELEHLGKVLRVVAQPQPLAIQAVVAPVKSAVLAGAALLVMVAMALPQQSQEAV